MIRHLAQAVLSEHCSVLLLLLATCAATYWHVFVRRRQPKQLVLQQLGPWPPTEKLAEVPPAAKKTKALTGLSEEALRARQLLVQRAEVAPPSSPSGLAAGCLPLSACTAQKVASGALRSPATPPKRRSRDEPFGRDPQSNRRQQPHGPAAAGLGAVKPLYKGEAEADAPPSSPCSPPGTTGTLRSNGSERSPSRGETSWLLSRGDIELCHLPDGSPWLLGQGGFGKARASSGLPCDWAVNRLIVPH